MLTHSAFNTFEIMRRTKSKHIKIGLILFVGVFNFAYPNKQIKGDSLYYNKCETSDFVMRWHYQYFCDHVFDPRIVCPTPPNMPATFNPKDVKPGDTIFVRNAPKFFQELHPHIEHPYIIVSAGESSDRMLQQYKQYLDEDNVIAWFGIHPVQMAIDHPKFHPIPLGINQSQIIYQNRHALNLKFEELRSTTKKEFLVYVNFLVYPRRKQVSQLFLDKSYCKYANRQKFDSYIHEMSQCYFTLSPEGTGPDCYRTWEALLVGSIPIVKTSCLDTLYDGLPVLIVNSWEEAANEEFLKNAYKKITSKKYDIRRLYTSYWTAQIEEIQDQFRTKHLPTNHLV